MFEFDINNYKNNLDDLFDLDEKEIEELKMKVEKLKNGEMNISDLCKKEEKKMTFEDAWDMTDIDIQYRYNYLDELLCEIDDEIMYLVEEIEKVKVDEQVAEEMWKNGFVEARDKLVQANRDRVRLNKRLKYLEEKYEVVYDMYDEVFFGILANIE